MGKEHVIYGKAHLDTIRAQASAALIEAKERRKRYFLGGEPRETLQGFVDNGFSDNQIRQIVSAGKGTISPDLVRKWRIEEGVVRPGVVANVPTEETARVVFGENPRAAFAKLQAKGLSLHAIGAANGITHDKARRIAIFLGLPTSREAPAVVPPITENQKPTSEKRLARLMTGRAAWIEKTHQRMAAAFGVKTFKEAEAALKAMRASGIGLKKIQKKLEAEGHNIARSTIQHWARRSEASSAVEATTSAQLLDTFPRAELLDMIRKGISDEEIGKKVGGEKTPIKSRSVERWRSKNNINRRNVGKRKTMNDKSSLEKNNIVREKPPREKKLKEAKRIEKPSPVPNPETEKPAKKEKNPPKPKPSPVPKSPDPEPPKPAGPVEPAGGWFTPTPEEMRVFKPRVDPAEAARLSREELEARQIEESLKRQEAKQERVIYEQK